MINFIIIYLFSYFLTYFGYILKKDESIKEELPELKTPLRYIIHALTIITYASLLYFYPNKILVITTIVILIILKILSEYKKFIKDIHNLILFGTTLIYTFKFNPEYIYISLLPMFILFFENSLTKKLNLKIESYKLLLILIILIIFNIL